MSKLLTILLAGVAVGILLAPDKGSATLKKIADRLSGYKDDAKDLINDSVDAMKAKAGSITDTVNDIQASDLREQFWKFCSVSVLYQL